MNFNKIPTVSIIVPVYKVEQYLDECVESIVSQTYRNTEILLIDDGSPDRCPEKCDAWAEKDTRIHVIHKKNGGLSDARNAGMAASSGAFIAFVDSDDILEPEYIEYLYRAICETGADISECGYQKFSDKPVATNRPNRMCSPLIQSREEALYHFSKVIHPVNHQVWDKLYRRELIVNEPFLYGRQAQDVLFSCHVLGKCNKIARIDNTLYHWRIRQGSASNGFISQRLDALETYWQSLIYLEEFYPQFVKDCKSYYLALCFGAYDWIMQYGSKENRASIMETVNSYRRRIKFTREEWRACSLPVKIRYICSHPALIKPSVRLRQLINRISVFMASPDKER